MKEKKVTPFMRVHLVLMVVLAIVDIGTVIFLLTGAASIYTADYAMWKTSIISNACYNAVNAAALVFGVIYLLKGYRKDAAFFCKRNSWIIFVVILFYLKLPEAQTAQCQKANE